MVMSTSLVSFGGTTIIYPQTQTYVPQQTTVVVQQPAVSVQTTTTPQTIVVQPQAQTVVVQQPATQAVIVEPPTTTEVVINNIAPIIRAITPLVVDRPRYPRIKHHCRPMPPRPQISRSHQPPRGGMHSPAPKGTLRRR